MADELPAHIFLAIEKEPPYAAAMYLTPENVLALGRAENLIDLKTYVKCLQTGVWHGYADKVEPLQFPAWALQRQ